MKNIYLLFFLINFNLINCFDYDFYSKNNNLEGVQAFFHYLNEGFNQKIQSAKFFNNTNFDWKYYVKSNDLNISSKKEAKEHYKSIGKKQKLKKCKKFNIAILLHLYNLDLIDEFISKINYFISINKLNKFYISINIPVGENIDSYSKKLNLNNKLDNKLDNEIFNKILSLSPYHKDLINKDNYQVLNFILVKLKNSLNLDEDKINIIFSENRGVDIGGFFLNMDYVIKNNLNIDYFVVLHTKTHKVWREILTSILKLKVNKLLNYYDFVNPCHFTEENQYKFPFFQYLLDYFNLDYRGKFYYPLGSMFISSVKLIDFFKSYNIFDIFKNFSFADEFHREIQDKFTERRITSEHAYMRFIGYLSTYFNFRTRSIDYID